MKSSGLTAAIKQVDSLGNFGAGTRKMRNTHYNYYCLNFFSPLTLSEYRERTIEHSRCPIVKGRNKHGFLVINLISSQGCCLHVLTKMLLINNSCLAQNPSRCGSSTIPA